MFRIVTVVLLMAITVPASAIAIIPATDPASTAIRTTDPRIAPMMQRLNDIKAIDKSTLTRMEKKNLRKEVKSIREEMKTIKGGIYLSVGAIIIVILLLILLI